jgi:tRNA-Thr(GGU) m(6)t(6)A37 methyltransferase TsaA
MTGGPSPSFAFQAIGIIRSPFRQRIDAPHQPTVAPEGGGAPEATLELDPSLPEEVLRDLEGFSHVWILFVLHRSEGWAPTVRPPRGPRVKRGVFATRSPHRPNPIGLSAVELAGIEGRTLRLRGVDLLDGTPVLDIKPYVPYADAFPDARAGWIDEVDAATGLLSAPGLRRPRQAR